MRTKQHVFFINFFLGGRGVFVCFFASLLASFIAANYYKFVVIITNFIQELRKYELLLKNYEFEVFRPTKKEKNKTR